MTINFENKKRPSIDSNGSNSSKLFKKNTTVLYEDIDSLGCGHVSRYTITYKVKKNHENNLNQLNFRLKNKMDLFLAPVFYLGPYSIYADCRPFNYDEFKDFKTDEVIQFNPDIKPFQQWRGVLNLNENSLQKQTRNNEEEEEDFLYYTWIIDGISQLSIHNRAKIPYLFEISFSNEDFNNVNPHNLTVSKHTAYDLWHEPPTISLEKPIHLVVVTHGIFSNVGGDMLFLRDKLVEHCKLKGENVIIRGYEENIGKSYKGIQFLGERLAEYIKNLIEVKNKEKYLDKNYSGIKEISFISHSLGGCVQSYAMAYIHKTTPNFFAKNGVKLKHFITMASPLLGTAVEMPSYANFALSLGGLGKTGRDLTLKHKNFFDFSINNKDNKPVLEIIARSPIFKEFSNRTLYANTLHDGIVPLRTSALLYLDWQTLDKLYKLFKANHFNFYEHKKQSEDESEAAIPKIHNHNSHKSHNPPPKPSAIIAAANLVFAKLPTQKYIHDLSSRDKDVVLHDKIYTPEEIPSPHYVNRSKWKKIFYPNDKKYRKEERIARYWHQDKDWRKVLVVLKGDAHNDIVVRRRFVNLFGCVAVKHLIENHFGLE